MPEPARIEEEQQYFDVVVDSLRRRIDEILSNDHAAADNKSQIQMDKGNAATVEKLQGLIDDRVAVGRFSVDPLHDDIGNEQGHVYVGYESLFNGSEFPYVVNWKELAAQRFYDADHRDPLGVIAKRTYDVEQNRVLDFDEVVFAELAKSVAELTEPQVGDALLNELERGRSGQLRDIVKTIQAAQYEIIRADPDRLLVVQGGPGTGKSVVALHRVSWLLYNHRDTIAADDVLVVGPNATFIRYVENLLPSLGDRAVRHTPVDGLSPSGIKAVRQESPEVAAIKGELRMEKLLRRGLQARISMPDESDFVQRGRIRALPRVPLDDLAKAMERFRTQSYSTGRSSMRAYLRELLKGRVDPAVLNDVSESFLERVWPQLTPMAFLQDLLGSSDRLLEAAGDDFTAAEVRLLRRRAAESLSLETWSPADVPLLDFADQMINGQTHRHAHVVVDEAQDLSPMQLRSIARRSSNGSMTVLGDIAQSTGTWARDEWDDVIELLRGDAPTEVFELGIGYRVPRQAFELAAALLPVIAPSVDIPTVVREGPEPRFVQAGDGWSRALSVAELAGDFAATGAMVGVICPESAREDVVAAFDAGAVSWRDVDSEGLGDGINLLLPSAAKGLEFDAVIVVEPEAIIDSDLNGGRLLYVALTRTIRDLVIVHVGDPSPIPPLPLIIDDVQLVEPDFSDMEPPTDPVEAADDTAEVVPQPADPPADGRDGPTDASEARELSGSPVTHGQYPRPILAIAQLMASELRETLRGDQIPILIEALRDELGIGSGTGEPD